MGTTYSFSTQHLLSVNFLQWVWHDFKSQQWYQESSGISVVISVFQNAEYNTNLVIFSACPHITSLMMHISLAIYRIMQIIHGGKVSRLHDLVIRGKTFAIV